MNKMIAMIFPLDPFSQRIKEFRFINKKNDIQTFIIDMNAFRPA